jgi:hypothetical protein
VTVFLQGLEKRGPDNLRKRIYFSGVTPDLYKPMYSPKVVAFFDRLMEQEFAGKPFMRHYLDYYFDLYWDLHLGVTGDAIPFEVRQIGGAKNPGGKSRREGRGSKSNQTIRAGSPCACEL